MPKTYIAKALTALSRQPKGPELCDKVAQRFSAMTSGSVRRINSALDFGWLKWAMRNVDPRSYLHFGYREDELPDVRRAALLVAKVFELKSEVQRKAESWDCSDLGEVFKAARQVGDLKTRGYFLKGSFWGFSNHSEREWTEQAWNEARWMIRCGLTAVLMASIEFGRVDNGPGREIFQRYFGTLVREAGMRKLQTVRTTLRKIQSGMDSGYVGITYQGMGVPAATQYQEYGVHLAGGIDTLTPKTTGWGYAKTCIGLGVNFFLPAETAIRRGTQHDVQRVEMGVTRGGALVHELSHFHAHTKDERLPNDSKTFLISGPVTRIEEDTAYGPTGCWGLARSSQFPLLSLTNADSYRCFCEDATVLFGVL